MQLSSIFSLLLLFVFTTKTTFTHAHNITSLLAKHPQFSTFNHYLSTTHLATEINSRTTITVCAVDNAAMSSILSKNPTITTLKNLLSFHVLLDYFNAKKLHQITDGTALAATLFQSTGTAPGSAGFVNITDMKGGKVALGPEDNGGKFDVFFVKELEAVPYNISVIQISNIMPSDVALAPAPGPSQMNLTNIMSAHGCKVFSDTLLANHEASSTYQDNIEGGLTVFCPMDDAFKAFLPKYKNLTASGKTSFLEYFSVPLYMSMSMLKSNNGQMNTLATDGASNFALTVQNDGDDVTLKANSITSKITGTIIDEQPLAVYTIDKVLLPKELFKQADTPAPAPAPDTVADSPKSSKKKTKKSKKSAPTPSDSPADSPDADGDVADQSADDNSVVRLYDGGRGIVKSVLCLCVGLMVL